MTKTVSITKVQQDLSTFVTRATKKSDKYFITVNGVPSAVLMSLNEYESLQETLEILSDPEAMKDIKEGEADIKAGRYYDWEDVKKELGLDVQTKNHRARKARTQKTS